MIRMTFIMPGRRTALATCTLMMGAAMLTTSCKDDLLTGQPEWLGNSIYERLQEDGNYSTMLRLIDDLGQTEYLSHTGSRTIFVANDSAYAEWFKKNTWGVTSYEKLTTAQKKLLLNNAMIKNAYLIELMSNGKAKSDNGTPEVGAAMRRETASSIYDSVYVMKPDLFPTTPAWDLVRSRGKAIPIYRDMTAAPMIHFLPAFMQANNITGEDLATLTNQQAHSTAEAWINGKRVSQRDITCKNGYIQKVDGVVESSPNMAEILHQHPSLSQWAHLVDRFSAPYYTEEGTQEYRRLYGTQDSVFVLRYFSERWQDPRDTKVALTTDDQGKTGFGILRFDPGWNQYVDARDNIDLHNDAGVMIAPTNEALERFWNNEGHELKDEYGEWDNVGGDILASLINNHLISTFTAAVPSKFPNVLNDALMPIGITTADVDSCFMGCNGVVYMTNKVFMPAEFQSVLQPALVHTSSMNIIYWALSGALGTDGFAFNFKPFLLAMSSRYALLLPTNEAMQTYIDPASYGAGEYSRVSEEGDTTLLDQVSAVAWQYDLTKTNPTQYVQAKTRTVYVEQDGSLTDASVNSTTLSDGRRNNMLENLINQLIIVIPDPAKTKTIEDYVDEGYNYFLTRSGSMVRVTRNSSGDLLFEGGWQMEGRQAPIAAAERYQKENGVSYQLEQALPLPTTRSLWVTLKGQEEYSAFLQVANNDLTGLFAKSKKAGADGTFTAGMSGNLNFGLFDNYNYTVYVPTSNSVRALQSDGSLPEDDVLNLPWADTRNTEPVDSFLKAEGWYPQPTGNNTTPTNTELAARRNLVRNALKAHVTDFVRYHVQDHSLAIGMAADSYNGSFETMKRNPANNRFYALHVDFDNQHLTVTDELGKAHQVIATPGRYNNVCREYWFRNNEQRMVSDAVVHLIDSPLHYATMKKWRDVVQEAIDNATAN